MGKLFAKFWRDERGYVPASEWMLAATILTLGSIAALLALRNSGDRPADCPAVVVQSGPIHK